MTIRGGVRRIMEKTILNFHFDYLNPSLTIKGKNIIFTFPHYEQGDFLFCNEKRPFDYMRYEVLSSLWGQCWFYTIYVSNNVAKAFKETYKLPNACNPKFRPNFVSAEICKILRPTLIYFVIFFLICIWSLIFVPSREAYFVKSLWFYSV